MNLYTNHANFIVPVLNWRRLQIVALIIFLLPTTGFSQIVKARIKNPNSYVYATAVNVGQIDKDVYLFLTVKHFLRDKGTCDIQVDKWIPCIDKILSARYDLGAVTIRVKHPQVYHFLQTHPQVNSKINLYSYPGNNNLSVASGILRTQYSVLGSRNTIPGDSGGGVFLRRGKYDYLVGIHWGAETRLTNWQMTPVSDIVDFITTARHKLQGVGIKYYYTDWCHYCKYTRREIRKLERKGVKVQWIDVDKYPSKIKSIPTVEIFVGKKYIGKIVGQTTAFNIEVAIANSTWKPGKESEKSEPVKFPATPKFPATLKPILDRPEQPPPPPIPKELVPIKPITIRTPNIKKLEDKIKDLENIVVQLQSELARIKETMKGEVSERIDEKKIISDQSELRSEISKLNILLKRLQNRKVQILSPSGKIVDERIYGPDDPIQFRLIPQK